MNKAYAFFCRAYQTVFRAALPILPYREPVQLDGLASIVPLLTEKEISSVLLVTDASVRACEQEVVRLVNAERAKHGLAALTEDWELSRVARYKSQDMHDNRYFAHNSPTYGTPFQMLRAFGLSYRTAGENIAMGYAAPAAVVAGWMNSEGHRANILNSAYIKIGVGYVADGHYWTQQFIG